MNENLLKNSKEYVKRRRRRTLWKRAVMSMATVVVFFTTYFLILPAITMSGTAYCGQEEHTHEEACYTTNLVCELASETEEAHTHTEECYSVATNLICTSEESEGHVHTEECKSTEQVLSCGTEEAEAHQHDETCYVDEVLSCGREESEGHVHTDSCYSENITYVCGQEEYEGHTHGESCYEEIKTLTCEKEETDDTESHQHEESCYEKVLECKIEEHTHSTICFSNPEADVETASDWEATLPDELTGVWADDVIAVAESQLGYEESTDNYTVTESGEVKGYSRYGDWYGDKYGDWCAMFVSFCLNYAEISEDEIPYEANCQNWVEKLQKLEIYEKSGSYEPEKGDLIFFEISRDGVADHVGLVTETTNDGKIKTIEGNTSDKVAYMTYDAEDESILGYGVLPENEGTSSVPEESPEEYTITAEEDWGTAAAEFKAGVLLEDTELVVNLLEESTDELDEALYEYVQKTNQEVVTSYYISVEFRNAEGNKTEPEGEVLISLEFASPMEVNQAQTFASVGDSEEETESEWGLYGIDESDSVSSLENEETAELGIGEENSLQTVTFAYQSDTTYAVAALAEGDDTVTSFEELKAALNQETTETIIIKLGEDISVNETLTIGNGKTVELDLNGYTLTAESGTIFNVNGGKLTIKDSAFEETDVKEGGASTSGVIRNLASYSDDKLTYYITESQVVNSSTGATTEKVQSYTVTLKGKIQAGDDAAVKISNNGTFTLESGSIVGGANRAVYQTGGTMNLAGGYICGNTVNEDHTNEDSANGGAVYASSGTVNVSGTVLAANTTAGRGGAIGVTGSGTVLNITGGVISGNQSTTAADSEEWGTHYGGGGVYCDDGSAVKMSGGYITNNYSAAVGYFDGGGGVLLDGSNTTFTITGGYVTGNEANGGGGIRTDWRSASTVNVSGGFICSNYARTAEGGGISISMDGSAFIDAGYINNNRTDTDNHWGGGGVFCSNGSKIFMHNVLITENDAGGFGGGVAGCSTGRVYITVKEGGAIFDNAATGQNMSGDDSTKSEDHTLAKESEVFMSNGYQDYFCALNSVVEGTMLGGGSANWQGSADGVPVTAGKGEVLVASSIMGLTANPISSGKDSAESVAELYINNNYSNTHGGGILANGYLIIGEVEDIYVNARVELTGTKAYLNDKKESLEMEAGEFKFTITDEETGAVITTGTNDEEGNITFADRIPFDKEGTFTYLLKEDPSDDKNVTMDTSIYRITVTVGVEVSDWFTEATGGADSGEETIIKKYQYLVEKIVVEKQNGTAWEVVSEKTPSNSEDSAIKLTLTGDATFTNYNLSTTNIKVIKQWTGNDDHPGEVTVGLYQNGELYGNKITLSEGNDWTHVWDELPLNADDGTAYEYTVEEDPVQGYQTRYEYYNKISDAGYWIPASEIEAGKQYIIVSPDGAYALYATDGHVNGRFDDSDKISISKGAESVEIDGVTYSDYYPEESIPTRSIYTAEIRETNNKDLKGTMLYSKEISSALLVEPGGKNTFKGGTGLSDGYFSIFSYSGNGLVGKKGWGTDKNDEYRVIYNNGVFTAVSAGESYNANTAAKLYTYIEGPITDKEMVYVITNTKTEDVTYSLDITKVSATSNDVKLEGAHFELKDSSGNTMYFIQGSSSGAYTLSDSGTDGSTTDLITGTHGKLVLSGLAKETYTLTETKAPAGYVVADPQTVTLGEDSSVSALEIVIEDFRETEFELPETGGLGTTVFTTGGCLLMVGSLLSGYFMKRKRERRGR